MIMHIKKIGNKRERVKRKEEEGKENPSLDNQHINGMKSEGYKGCWLFVMMVPLVEVFVQERDM
eukprot:CAMPEP_0201528382 /NCGR_PEP_ID=MMETSP0161_2-20130828/38170_1 /ASSEMBLY_ACC=CAM_ASM_000251 /TAXON_ID=180227 /ORGANISM="Neoparamoeba aestuarina, Strain SoJaBio B1-5/56/2" /LENGTH=63 /DNA_ID=CAMNT_0047929641 /DNA_START=113 /DNA_END=304 /DNA_ORIENTATION=-